jgi:hypothetical protein
MRNARGGAHIADAIRACLTLGSIAESSVKSLTRIYSVGWVRATHDGAHAWFASTSFRPLRESWRSNFACTCTLAVRGVASHLFPVHRLAMCVPPLRHELGLYPAVWRAPVRMAPFRQAAHQLDAHEKSRDLSRLFSSFRRQSRRNHHHIVASSETTFTSGRRWAPV